MRTANTVSAMAVVASLLTVGGCTKYESQTPSEHDAATTPVPAGPPAYIDETAVTLEPGIDLPVGLKAETIAPGECMTPIDQINGAPVTASGYAAAVPAVFDGWNVTSSRTDATPALIYGVLKPYDKGQRGSLLSGERLPRPDVAGDNQLYANAGYKLSGTLPSQPGRYRFYVWTGTPEAIVECDSRVVVTIR